MEPGETEDEEAEEKAESLLQNTAVGGEEQAQEDAGRRRSEGDQLAGGLVTDESETEVQCYVLEQHYGPSEDCS